MDIKLFKYNNIIKSIAYVIIYDKILIKIV